MAGIWIWLNVFLSTEQSEKWNAWTVKGYKQQDARNIFSVYVHIYFVKYDVEMEIMNEKLEQERRCYNYFFLQIAAYAIVIS